MEYTYNISNINVAKLVTEIEEGLNVSLSGSSADGYLKHYAGVLTVTLTLDATQETTLANIVAAHDGIALPITEYWIYDYLTESAKDKFKDFSVTPHSVDYIIDMNKRLHKQTSFTGGFLTLTTYYDWDSVNDVAIQEVLKVEEEYTLENDSLYDSTKTVKKRVKKRWWLTKDNIYIAGTEKVTTKMYSNVIAQREEGKRRRNNIITFVSQDYVQLRMFLLGETQTVAEEETFNFASDYSKDLSNFREGSYLIINNITADTTNTFLDNVITSNAYTDVYFPAYIGQTVRDRILDRLKGLI